MVLWPALILALVYLPSWGFGLLAAVAITVSFLEYLRLTVIPRNKTIGWLATATGCVCTLAFVTNSSDLPFLILIFGSLLVLTVSMVIKGSLSDNLIVSALAITGLIYVVVPLGLVILLRFQPGGTYQIGFLFAVTWARDVGAFLFGQRLPVTNVHLISRAISHTKTYEGAVGGIIASLVAALIARRWIGPDIGLIPPLALGLLMGLVGQLGDLVESMIKRVAKVSNSSDLIPGQGGLLDTLDGFIYTAPLLYVFSTFKT